MFEQALKICLSLIFIIFSIYPRGIVSNIIGNQKEYLVGRQSVFPSYAQSILQAHRSPTLRSRAGLDSKSGFDLNDEEMQKFKIWKDGVIPFYIDIPSFSDKSVRAKIRWVLNEVNSKTKLNFIELPKPPVDYDEERWVYFLNRQSYLGCHDVFMSNFTLKGIQRVVLGYECLSTPGGIYEIVLALAGVPPQHNAPNRDEYIEVVEENIIPEKKYLYEKLDDQDWLFHDLPYDYESASHFHQHKHSVNGSATILIKGENDIGVQDGFSKIDIFKINLLYTYMVKKSKTYMPECQKLFAEVEDLGNVPQSIEDLKPVPKPNKYLGISDDEDKGDEDKGDKDKGDEDKGDEDKGDEDKGDKDKGDEDKDDEDKGDADKGDEDKGDEDKGDEDKGDKDNQDKYEANRETTKRRTTKRRHLPFNIDPYNVHDMYNMNI